MDRGRTRTFNLLVAIKTCDFALLSIATSLIFQSMLHGKHFEIRQALSVCFTGVAKSDEMFGHHWPLD